MTGNYRVMNVDSRKTLKFSQAMRKIEDGLCAWVEYGVSIRTLTLAEQIAARNEIARLAEPMPLAEIHEARAIPPPGAVWSSKLLALDANAFAAGYYHPVSA